MPNPSILWQGKEGRTLEVTKEPVPPVTGAATVKTISFWLTECVGGKVMERNYPDSVDAFLKLLSSARKTDPSFSGVGVYMTPRPGEVVELRNIDVMPGFARGEGRGTLALSKICELADIAGVGLYVQPEARLAKDSGRLRAWYDRHGFAETPEDGRLLRQPTFTYTRDLALGVNPPKL